MPELTTSLQEDINRMVAIALEEDIGCGDISAELIPPEFVSKARIITREPCIIAGQAWVNEVFYQLDERFKTFTSLHWSANEGDAIDANTMICEVHGNARVLLTGERTALNFLQLLSGTATLCKEYSSLVNHTSVKLLDTRKTIPGLRTAQKYAVTCGGCYNHRIGLYDAFLIKENHIAACGNITAAISQARNMHPGKKVEVEVESLEELNIALNAKADIVMLDNFSLAELQEGVITNQNFPKYNAHLEASGGITRDSLVKIAETGVDFISIGALTKDCKAVDLSMRFI